MVYLKIQAETFCKKKSSNTNEAYLAKIRNRKQTSNDRKLERQRYRHDRFFPLHGTTRNIHRQRLCQQNLLQTWRQ